MSVELLNTFMDTKVIDIPGVEYVREDILGWEKVPINECGERLVALSLIAPDLFITERTFLRQLGKEAENLPDELYLREGVVKRLIKAAERLQEIDPEYKFLIYDAYRPIERQKQYFENKVRSILEKDPQLSVGEAIEQAKRYVSFPSENPMSPPVHSTGGAVDLVIIKGIQRIPMKSDDLGAHSLQSETDYYNDAKSESELTYKKNRELLNRVMTEQGFTNYPKEYWHYDYGDQFWGVLTQQEAIYGRTQLNQKAQAA